MKESRFSEERIIAILRDQDAGTPGPTPPDAKHPSSSREGQSADLKQHYPLQILDRLRKRSAEPRPGIEGLNFESPQAQRTAKTTTH
jgi:hypothetical protein